MTQLRTDHFWLIFTLPLTGFTINWIYQKYHQSFSEGLPAILQSIANSEKRIPLTTAPLIYLSTLLTHLSGGSAGRESTSVQISISLSDLLFSFFRLTKNELQTLRVTALGAGFGSAIGAPWAGTLYGMEITSPGRFKIHALIPSLIANFTCYRITKALAAPHLILPQILIPELNSLTVLQVIAISISFGLTAVLFTVSVKLVREFAKKLTDSIPLQSFWGGIIILIFYFWEGSFLYTGLGLSEIQNSFFQIQSWPVPLLKCFLTALTLGFYFKGGEFIPLVFIGTTMGSFLSQWLGVEPSFFSALGFTTVYAAVTRTPKTCALLSAELFGFQLLLWSFISSFIADKVHLKLRKVFYKP